MKARFKRLSLEHLESRITPDTYVWRGMGNNLWNTPSNWVDMSLAGNPVATVAPNKTTTCIFDTDSGNCLLSNEIGTCKNLISTRAYAGFLELQGASVFVMNTSQDGTKSAWNGGVIEGINNPANPNNTANLYIQGGWFTYAAQGINSQGGPQAAALTVWAGSSATLTFKGNFVTEDAQLNIGYDTHSNPSFAKLYFNTPNSTVRFGTPGAPVPTGAITGSAQSTIDLGSQAGGGTTMTGVSFSSAGTVNLGTGTTISMANNPFLVAGLTSSLTAPSAPQTVINGNVVLISSFLDVTSINNPGNLITVNGNLTLSDTMAVFYCSAGFEIYDSITATNITVDSSDTLMTYTWGTIAQKVDHIYYPMQATGAFSGTFSLFQNSWLGNGTAWTVMYDPQDLIVTQPQEQPGSISGTVFEDLDENGIDVLDPGVAGVTVTVIDSNSNIIATTTTAADGTYSVPGLAPGAVYTVRFSLAGNGSFSIPENGDNPELWSDVGIDNSVPGTIQGSAAVVANGPVTSCNAGIIFQTDKQASISGTIWNDLAQQGYNQTGDPDVANLTVSLYNAKTDQLVATTQTDVNGQYSFNNLLAGQYTVVITPPPGWIGSPTTSDDPFANGSLGYQDTTWLTANGQYVLNAGMYDTVQVSTSINLTASANFASIGQPVTFMAAVMAADGSTPTGTVSFYNGTTLLATVTLTNGQATYTTPFYVTGTMPITAVYAGGGGYTGSTSNEFDLTVIGGS